MVECVLVINQRILRGKQAVAALAVSESPGGDKDEVCAAAGVDSIREDLAALFPGQEVNDAMSQEDRSSTSVTKSRAPLAKFVAQWVPVIATGAPSL
jgi:hypothetical protein